MCGFELQYEPFGFKFKDDRTGDAVISSEGQTIIMMDRYL